MKKIISKIFLGIGLSFCLVLSLHATDFSNEQVTTWKDDGYPLLKNANGIVKIIGFTNAADYVNKGNYKIIFKDPFDGTNQLITAYIDVTRLDNSSPMYVKLGIIEGSNNRYVFVKVNKGVSSTYPLGDFEMITYALGKTKPLNSWNTTSTYDRADLVISANGSSATVKIAIEGRDNGNAPYTGWMNLQANDSNFTSGQGTMNNFGNLNVNIAFDNKYILDKNSSNGGTLSYRSQFNSKNYGYKLFNTNGSNIALATNEISSFSFQSQNGYDGFIGSNYDNNQTSVGGISVTWSGRYYINDKTLLHQGDTITSKNSTTYTISKIDPTNGFIMLTKNGTTKKVSSFSPVTISGHTYYKSGRKLFPALTNNNGSGTPTGELNDGSSVTISGNSYKVKATMIQKSKKIIAQRTLYTNLDQNVTASSDKTKVNSLKASVVSSLANPNLTFDTTDLENVKTWFDNLDKNSVPLKVLNGKNIQ